MDDRAPRVSAISEAARTCKEEKTQGGPKQGWCKTSRQRTKKITYLVIGARQYGDHIFCYGDHMLRFWNHVFGDKNHI